MRKMVIARRIDVPGEVTPARSFTLKELSEIFHSIESTKDKVLQANPNLGRRMKTEQYSEKDTTSVSSYITRRTQSLLISSFFSMK